jgi:GNAT superfamily N-acetyltransferase
LDTAGPGAGELTAHPTLSVTELETIAALGWRGTSTAPLGQWLLRAGHGFTGRANSVLPLGSAGCALDDALAAVLEFYRSHTLPPVFQLPEDAPGSDLAELDAELQRRGWRAYNHTCVMTASVSSTADRCPAAPGLPPALFEQTPGAGWLSGYFYRGNPLPSTAIRVLVNADAPVFVSIAGDAQGSPPAGVARGVLTQGWLGVTAVTVAESRRRQGVGRQLMGELARWAGPSADSIYLQVDRANTVAIAMYERLGFTTHHGYHYLAAPA